MPALDDSGGDALRSAGVRDAVRVGIAAPSALIRDGLAAALGALPEIAVVAVVATAADLAQARGVVDAIVVDTDDLDAGLRDRLQPWFTDGPVIVILADTQEATPLDAPLAQCLLAGIAVLPRAASIDAIAAAIGAGMAGLVAVDPARLQPWFDAAETAGPSSLSLIEPLTAREREVLQLMAGGGSNKAIAARLTISEHTAKFHVRQILAKLQAASRTEAVARGLRGGLISA